MSKTLRQSPSVQRMPSTLTRRGFLSAMGLSAATLAAAPILSGCSTGDDGTNLSFSGPIDAVETNALFEKYAAEFEGANPGTTVTVGTNGAGNFDQWFQARLAAKNAPDVLRSAPVAIGRYIANGGMLDISDYLPDGYGEQFNQTFWSQVSPQDGGIFGIPQTVSTIAIYYRRSMIEQVGARIPTSPDDAWTWDEFIEISKEVKDVTGSYAFSYSWSAQGAYYWLPILYQHGGALVEDDLRTPAVVSDEAISALEWTKSWFDQGLISPANSIQGTSGDDALNLFTTEQVGMMVNGHWKLTNARDSTLDPDDWDVTYLFRDVETASMVGGSIVGVTRDVKNPELATELAQTMCSEENMREFCAKTLFLPARNSLAEEGGVPWEFRPEVVDVFVQQSAAIPEAMYRLQTSPYFSTINTAMGNELGLCFTGQQSASDTVANIATVVEEAVA